MGAWLIGLQKHVWGVWGWLIGLLKHVLGWLIGPQEHVLGWLIGPLKHVGAVDFASRGRGGRR